MRKTKQFATRSGNKIFHIRQADSYQETEWNDEIYSQLPVPLEPPFSSLLTLAPLRHFRPA